ncbi:MAG: class I SAM-dependent methyltransferase [Bacteroidia bacterium]
MTGTKAAFDAAAAQYDLEFSESTIGKMQRNRVWQVVDQLLRKENIKTVLELNGGTGVDALAFAKRGLDVTTTDLSANMMELVRQKAVKENLKVETFACDFASIGKQFTGKQFDFIFSNFGGLNCIDAKNFQLLTASIHTLLKPNGCCVLVIMSRDCWWERFYFKRKNKPHEAARRMQQGPVETILNGHKFPIWYYSPTEIETLVNPFFQIEQKRAVGWMIPPSYLESFFKSKKLVLRFFNWLENWFGNRQSLAARGDHFLLVLRRNDD